MAPELDGGGGAAEEDLRGPPEAGGGQAQDDFRALRAINSEGDVVEQEGEGAERVHGREGWLRLRGLFAPEDGGSDAGLGADAVEAVVVEVEEVFEAEDRIDFAAEILAGEVHGLCLAEAEAEGESVDTAAAIDERGVLGEEGDFGVLEEGESEGGFAAGDGHGEEGGGAGDGDAEGVEAMEAAAVEGDAGVGDDEVVGVVIEQVCAGRRYGAFSCGGVVEDMGVFVVDPTLVTPTVDVAVEVAEEAAGRRGRGGGGSVVGEDPDGLDDRLRGGEVTREVAREPFAHAGVLGSDGDMQSGKIKV